MLDSSFSFFLLKVCEGALYSLSIGVKSLVVCIPFALFFAFLFRKENIYSKTFITSLDVVIALPNQLLLLSLAGIAGGSAGAIILSVFVTQVPGLIRHLRVYVVQAEECEFVEASRALGATKSRLFFCHIFPRLFMPVSISSLALLKRVILSETLLMFLGLGFDPLTPSLGRLLSEGRSYLFLSPERFFIPAIILFLLLYVLQTGCDRFSSLFDPKGVRYL
jgi:ABC-type dipeptide/oligopeptide/nickel transport system permease subunit